MKLMLLKSNQNIFSLLIRDQLRLTMTANTQIYTGIFLKKFPFIVIVFLMQEKQLDLNTNHLRSSFTMYYYWEFKFLQTQHVYFFYFWEEELLHISCTHWMMLVF